MRVTWSWSRTRASDATIDREVQCGHMHLPGEQDLRQCYAPPPSRVVHRHEYSHDVRSSFSARRTCSCFTFNDTVQSVLRSAEPRETSERPVQGLPSRVSVPVIIESGQS